MQEAEKDAEEEDGFASLTKFGSPTPSQEAIFPFCPMVRESDVFADSVPSSPEPTLTEPTAIVMLSVSDSDSADVGAVEEEQGDVIEEQAEEVKEEEEEENAVYHTPPEHHLRYSSSEEQNFFDLGDGFAELKEVRVSEGGLDDESQLNGIKVMEEEELMEETVPVGETEMVLVEIEGNEKLKDTDVIVLDGSDSGEDEEMVNLRGDSVEVDKTDGVLPMACGDEGGQLVKDLVSENHEFVENSEAKEDVEVNARNELREESVVAQSEEVVKVTEGGKVSKDGANGDGGLRTDVESFDRIDKFRYVGGEGVKSRGKVQTARGGCDSASRTRQLPVTVKGKEKNVEEMDGNAGRRRQLPVMSKGKEKSVEERDDGAGRRRQLPVTTKGKEKSVEERDDGAGSRCQLPVTTKGKVKNMEKRDEMQEMQQEPKSGILEYLDVLKMAVGNVDDGPEEVDFLKTAKKQGLKFPRPRWWPPEGQDW